MKKAISILLALALVLALPIAGMAEGFTVTEKGTLPVVEGERPTYTCVVGVGVFIEDMNTNTQSLWYEEQTNVHIEYEQINENDTTEKVGLKFASGDLPDFFMNVGSSISSMEGKYGVEEGMIIPLDEYIDEYMVYMHEALETFPIGSLDTIRQYDGKIYGLPIMSDCFHCVNAAKIWINTTWLDALDLEMPTTTDEFYAVLKAFKEKDPNGNGAADEIPFAGSITGWNATPDKAIMNAFLYYDLSIADGDIQSNGGWFIDDEGKIDTALNKEACREGWRYINKLYTEGLIYEASFTQQNEALVQIGENPEGIILGAAPGGWGAQFSQVPSKATKTEDQHYENYMTVPALKGPEGVQYAITYTQDPYTALWITDVCENPEVICRWADYMYSTEGTLTFRHGAEGTNWRWAEDGEVGINGKPAIWTELIPWNDSEPQNEYWVSRGVFAETDELRLGMAMDPNEDIHTAEGNELMLYQETAKNYRPYAAFDRVVPSLKFTDDVVDEWTALKVDYGKYVKQWAVHFMTGAKSLDTDWQEYLDGLEQLKLPRMLELMNAAYTAQYGA